MQAAVEFHNFLTYLLKRDEHIQAGVRRGGVQRGGVQKKGARSKRVRRKAGVNENGGSMAPVYFASTANISRPLGRRIRSAERDVADVRLAAWPG